MLLTRPRADSEELASILSRRGYDCIVEPLLSVDDTAAPAPDLRGVQAFLVTSANGARALARWVHGAIDLPLFAVGQASAQAARDGGFEHVFAAAGDVMSLARLVRDRLDPQGGAVLHAAGTVVAGDLAGDLAAHGFAVRRIVLYRAEPAAALSPAVRAELAAGTIDAVLLYSPRTARKFVHLVRESGLPLSTIRLTVLCLSHAVAADVRELPLAHVLVAASPTQSALLDLLETTAIARQ